MHKESRYNLEHRREVERELPPRFVTDQGSIYTLGEDNRYSRHKTKTGEKFPPMDITVFMRMPEPYNPYVEMSFLAAAQRTGNIRVGELDENGQIKEIRHNSEIEVGNEHNLLVMTVDRLTKEPMSVPASLYPFEGGQVYEEGITKEGVQRHVGSQVTEIG